MRIVLRILLLVLLVPFAVRSLAQSDHDKAKEIGLRAVHLSDEGKFDEAIGLLEQAIELDPARFDYPYEIAFALYGKQDYKASAKQLEKLLHHKDVSDRAYQLLGNCYDNLGKGDKAVETYEAGLKLFPNSGNLYLELGVIQLGRKDYNKALEYCETGIKVAPHFPSNYYWAARLYLGSTEKVWGMIYGEIFMNMERSSKRTAEVSKLLFDTYKSQIRFTSDSSMSVSFSKNATIAIGDASDVEHLKLPFGVGVYEPTLVLGVVLEKSIDLASLDRIRMHFLETYFQKDFGRDYPNILFDYQKKVNEAGHLEAYNHWILMKGDEDGFATWAKANDAKWQAFTTWFKDQPMVVDDDHRFWSGQY